MKDSSTPSSLIDLTKLSVRDIISNLGKISEDRSRSRTNNEIVRNLSRQSFAQEIENDKRKSAAYINRAVNVENKLGKDNPLAKQEKAAVDVYKRALLLAGASGLTIINGDKSKSAADNGLPVCSYLHHGGRIMIQIPPGSGDKLINWLSSGDPTVDGRSRKQTQQGAIAEDKIVYNRPAATHGVSIKDDGKNGFKLKEKKGLSIGIKDFLSNKLFGKKTNHFGVDLALNAEYGQKDPEGKVVDRPDGDHGHLYIHYIRPTEDKPGSILIGVEGAAPTSSKHSKLGASDPISPIGGSKFDQLVTKHQLSTESTYKDSVVPQKYDAMQGQFTNQTLDEITKLKADNFGTMTACAMPGKSCEDFSKKLESKDYHQTPELKEPELKEHKDIDGETQLLKKPSILKRITNIVVKIVTLGMLKPFKKQIEQYKADSKLAKVKSAMEKGKEDRETSNTNPIFKRSESIGQDNTKLIPDKKKNQQSTIQAIRQALDNTPEVPPKSLLIGSHRVQPKVLQKRRSTDTGRG